MQVLGLIPTVFYSFTRTFVAIWRILSGSHQMNRANQGLQKQGAERDDIRVKESVCNFVFV